MKRIVLVCLLLVACHRQPTKPATVTPASGLEAAAIEAGVIADPASTDITGIYARDTDRVCIVPAATAYRIGVFADYGEDQTCGASGTVRHTGETLDVSFPQAPGCAFEARYEGDRIVFPGQVPADCARLCRGRASIAALDIERLSDSEAEASTMRDAKGKLLCSGG